MTPTVLSEGWRHATVQHRCQLCGRVIESAERYRAQTNKGDDGIYTWKECIHCVGLVHETTVLCDADLWGEGYGPDTVIDWEPVDLRELRLKALWRKQWRRKDGALYPVPMIDDKETADE